MDVLILNTWITNIGNGFIDKGAKVCVKNALQDARIIESSGLGNKAFAQSEFKFVLEKLRHDLPVMSQLGTRHSSRSIVNVAELTNADLAVLPGCVLDRHMEWYEDTLRHLSERNIPIVLLGAGGRSYDNEIQTQVQRKLDQLNVIGLITRDDRAYECYSSHVEHAYQGIDCGFFINDWHQPAAANQNFIAATFDHKSEPSLSQSERIIRPNHRSLTALHSGLIPYMTKVLVQKYRDRSLSFFENKNIFLSDRLEDYLFIYANATETYADRIHACVPSLAYGNTARFYRDTPRMKLFEGLVKGNITKELVEIDREGVAAAKERQYEALRTITSDI